MFRTEGNHQQGMGDLWGGLALADECVAQGDECIVVVSGGDEAIAMITERGHRFSVAISPAVEEKILLSFLPDVILVNQLNNPPSYIESLRRHATLVVTMDDTSEGAQRADLNINVLYHKPGAVVEPQYIALREEFRVAHTISRSVRSEVKEVLVTQGGSDTYGFTPRIVRALERMTFRPHCTVVVGPAFRHHDELQEALSASSLGISVLRSVREMSRLMIDADLAVTAGGLTMFELACVGTPSVVVCGERFEVETAARLEQAGAVVNLGFGDDLNDEALLATMDWLARDVERRRHMAAKGKQLVDGRGCERILRLIRARLAEVTGAWA
ncbi:MAG: hypothetical protein D4R81_07775 [Nitrospiraceae bacterium]|nr:MAG: hypothetical protein D4R81_07775 [Nitrospiraceae bacterium]